MVDEFSAISVIGEYKYSKISPTMVDNLSAILGKILRFNQGKGYLSDQGKTRKFRFTILVVTLMIYFMDFKIILSALVLQ